MTFFRKVQSSHELLGLSEEIILETMPVASKGKTKKRKNKQKTSSLQCVSWFLCLNFVSLKSVFLNKKAGHSPSQASRPGCANQITGAKSGSQRILPDSLA